MFILNDPKSEKETIIFVKIHIKGNIIKKSTGLKVHPANWENHRTPNKSANSILNKIETFVSEQGFKLTNNNLSEYINSLYGKSKKAKNTFIEGCEKIIADMKSGALQTKAGTPYAPGTVVNYEQFIQDAKSFGLKDFDNITMETYHAYIDHCNRNGLSLNTTGSRIKLWMYLLKIAHKRGYHSNLIYLNEDFKKLSEETPDIYLEDWEIELIYKKDLSSVPRMDIARDWFIIACFTGLRVSDLLKLKDAKVIGGNIVAMNKKTGEKVVIPAAEKVRAVIKKRRGFPPKITDVELNRTIKDVAEAAGIKGDFLYTATKGGVKTEQYIPRHMMISSHTGRRTSITNTLAGGVPTEIVMKIHGIRSHKTLNRYNKLTPEQAAAIAKKHDFYK